MKSIFKILFVALIIGISANGKASESDSGSISGAVFDSETHEPLWYASVLLVDKLTGRLVADIVTADDGTFKFSNVQPGKYELQISFVGYKKARIETVEVTKKCCGISLGAFNLNEETSSYDELARLYRIMNRQHDAKMNLLTVK